MTSPKVQGLLVLAALLLVSMAPTETEVVKSIADCSTFFLLRNPPHIPGILEGGRILDQNRYKPICQTYQNARTFVTLYDTKNKIPVFSAARYNGSITGRPKASWHIEPELENNVNMKDVKTNCSYENQAEYRDYSGSGFDKGHLLPSSYGYAEEEKNSTFTLTNIVPQIGSFNKGSWRRMESCVKCVLDKYCISNNEKVAFVVIGAKPSNGTLLNEKINIPSMLWSAFCCNSSSQGRWLASAHWGENIPEDNEKKHLQTKTLAELYNQFGQFNVFPGEYCPLNTTVSELYPKLHKNCECPPPNQSTTASPTTPSTPFTMTSNPSTELTSTSGDPRTTSGILTSSVSQPTTTFPSTTKPQTTTTSQTNTVPATTPKSTTAKTVRTTTTPPPPTTTAITTTTPTTAKKKKYENEQEKETEQRENNQNSGEGSDPSFPNKGNGIGSQIAGIGSALIGILASIGGTLFVGSYSCTSPGTCKTATDPLSSNVPPVATTNSEIFTTTFKSAIIPSNFRKTTTVPEKAMSIHPVSTTLQSSTIPLTPAKNPASTIAQTTSLYGNSAVNDRSTSSTVRIPDTTRKGKESLSIQPYPTTAAVTARTRNPEEHFSTVLSDRHSSDSGSGSGSGFGSVLESQNRHAFWQTRLYSHLFNRDQFWRTLLRRNRRKHLRDLYIKIFDG